MEFYTKDEILKRYSSTILLKTETVFKENCDSIMNKIEELAADGYQETTFYNLPYNLIPALINFFKGLGYDVIYSERSSSMKISWKA
tara:strand:+ start:1919 stop:2179 length:261 start_codon:yes stop_codon:yes gene_type:complete